MRWDTAPRARRRARAATSSSSPTPSRPSPSRRIGRAAIELLEAAGYRVRLESAGCCGRVEHLQGPARPGARHGRRRWPARLAPDAERGVPIVGCEPSCLLTLREEHLQLLPGDPRAQAVAEQAKLVEELLVEAIDDGALQLDPASPVAGRADRLPRPLPPEGAGRHRRDRRAAASASRAPRSTSSTPAAAGWRARSASRPSTTSCRCRSASRGCSRRCGPPRRATLVAATGVSCRQQIGHGAGQRARHPVELVRAALAA